MNHPFVDGNKRIVFAVVDVFLTINGSGILPDSKEVGDFIYDLFDNNAVTFDALDSWLRENTRPMSS